MALITKSIVTVAESTVASEASMKTVHVAFTDTIERLAGSDALPTYRQVAVDALVVGNLPALRSAFLAATRPAPAVTTDDPAATALRAKVAQIGSDSAFFEGRLVAVAEDFLADCC